jgi:tetratricopeptide (TPR) repeat protein
MHVRRSLEWGALALATLAGASALALGLGRWDAYALDQQGRDLVAERQYLSAARVLARAVAQAPGDARAHYYLGLAYAGIGLCGAAWFHLDQAVRLAPAYGRPLGDARLYCRGAAGPEAPELSDHAVHPDRQPGGALS